MPNLEVYNLFFDAVKKSIISKTFAKLTLAKTIGNSDLMNIYVRAVIVENKIGFEITFKYQQEERIEISSLENGLQLILPYMNNPFMSMLLFTTKADVTLKLNKKRVASITEKAPTFKNASENVVNFTEQ
ncbi:MAG: hypothetical protein H7239_09140 [Flavobacterium sp.]|nr:hypothetical protein [Flavobacterium sp.]